MNSTIELKRKLAELNVEYEDKIDSEKARLVETQDLVIEQLEDYLSWNVPCNLSDLWGIQNFIYDAVVESKPDLELSQIEVIPMVSHGILLLIKQGKYLIDNAVIDLVE